MAVSFEADQVSDEWRVSGIETIELGEGAQCITTRVVCSCQWQGDLLLGVGRDGSEVVVDCGGSRRRRRGDK